MSTEKINKKPRRHILKEIKIANSLNNISFFYSNQNNNPTTCPKEDMVFVSILVVTK